MSSSLKTSAPQACPSLSHLSCTLKILAQFCKYNTKALNTFPDNFDFQLNFSFQIFTNIISEYSDYFQILHV